MVLLPGQLPRVRRGQARAPRRRGGRAASPALQAAPLKGRRLSTPPLVALFNHAIACGNAGRWKEALEAYERLLRAAPGHALSWNNRGNVLQVFARWDDALASYAQALRLDPGYVDAVYNRATVLHRMGRWQEALEGYERALAMKPGHADALNNRAAVLDELGRSQEALPGFDQALAARPGYAQAHSNKARVLQELGRWDEALAHLEQAVALDPALVEAQWNRALLLLLRGDYERGWPAYEWCWKVESMRPFLREFAGPQWSGGESLAGKVLLVHAEQGIGDTLQFSRYLPRLVAGGARVILEAVPPLRDFLAANFPGVEVIRRGDALPRYDAHCALGRLPLAFGTTLETVPPPVRLFADDGKVRAWAARLGERRATRVGIAWAGNPTHSNDRRRTIALERFAPLLAEPFEFHVLQKDLRMDPAAFRGAYPHVRTWSGEMADFTEAAALVENLDLVISVDTAAAHLAGSMGKPTWVLLSNVPDFRWLLEREDSPWYPSMRLFRQPRRDDWESVIENVRWELKKRE